MPSTISRNPSVTNLSRDISAYIWPNNNAACHLDFKCTDGPGGLALQACHMAKDGHILLLPTRNQLGKVGDEGKPVTIWATWILTLT